MPAVLSSFSPLMVAPSLPTSSSASTSPAHSYNNHSSNGANLSPSHQSTCRVIVGPTDTDYITLIINPHTTVQQLKQDAIKHIAARDHIVDSGSSDVIDQYMIVRRLNPRALMSSYGSSMSSFLPQMSTGLMSSAPFNTMVPGFALSPASTLPLTAAPVVAAASSAASPTSAPAASRPAPPTRAAPRKPNTNGNSPVSTAPTSPTSASVTASQNITAAMPPNTSSTASSAATSPRTATTTTHTQQQSAASTTVNVPSLSFPLAMFSGGGTLMRLDDTDIIHGRHDDARYDLMLERVTDDVHIRLSIEDEQLRGGSGSGSGTISLLPVPSDMGRTQSHELASRLAPSNSASTSASSVFSFPMPHHSTSASTSITALAASQAAAIGNTSSAVDTIERESELSAGLDVCLMSIHGTYLQSAGTGDLRVACLDNCATFTLVDSNACDENGQCYRYLRTERGEYLAADSQGRLYLDDINQRVTIQSSIKGREEEEKTMTAPPTAVDDSNNNTELGLLTRNHRWTIKRGPAQSLLSAHSHYLTIAEEGDITLTTIRYEESCLHICFAVLQGALRKKQESGLARLRRWQSKWFVLSGSTLTFYEQQDDIYNRDNNAAIASKLKQQQQQSKNSKNSSSTVNHHHHNSDNGNTYSTAGILSINVHPAPSCRFDVEFVNGRVLEVKASTDEERERWVAALRNGKVGKKMDAKAKEGKKKKERQQTLRQKQTAAAAAVGNPNSVNKQRWDGEEKTALSSGGGGDHSVSSQSTAVLTSAAQSNRRQPAPLRIQTHASGTSTPQTHNSTGADDDRQPLAIMITHHHTGADTPSGALSGSAAATGMGHAHTPSFTSSPELSLYKSGVGISPFPVSSISSQSQSGRSTPLSSSQRMPAFVMASKPTGHRRRSLSIG